MAAPLPVRQAFSAGGVVWRRSNDNIQIVVCSRDRLRCLPKGTPEAGESAVATALREVREETGLDVEAGQVLGAIKYWFARDGRRVHKTVRWWLMEPVGGDLAAHDGEFDDVRWIDAIQALTELSYMDERGIVERALQVIAERPVV
jgi:8-oxo-dGTP pyrophosphatase MutT (NUDIX family)